jgi:lysyl-tRNA synthetase class 2
MSELDEQIANRKTKRDALRAQGIEPYPIRYRHDLEPHEVHDRYGTRTAEELAALGLALRVPGRVTAVRRHGKVTFLDLWDGKAKLQLFVRAGELQPPGEVVLDHLDLGDVVGAGGTLMRTRLGELSLQVTELTVLAKALRPLPEKWHGLTDVEARYRQRYLDLLANPESRQVFELRSKLVRGIRRFLDDRGFLEVETPMMHRLAGGATARPFVTHHNALDLPLYLRIAPELFLKRLLVGGLPRVYEINRNFRNEGISVRHNPEFTMLEFYWAYADYRDCMDLTEELLETLATDLLGEPAITWQGQRISLARPFQRLTMRDAVVELGGVPAAAVADTAGLAGALAERGLALPEDRTYGNLLAALFEGTVEEHLSGPVFILDYPVEISPLAKQCPGNPRFTERFELFLGGMEIANSFSELNDPQVQGERFRQQLLARERGDQEAHQFDHDYVRALEHGMPPAGGEGIGIDRLTMLFTDRPSIRDVILFPLLRPEAGEGDGEEEQESGEGQKDVVRELGVAEGE